MGVASASSAGVHSKPGVSFAGRPIIWAGSPSRAPGPVPAGSSPGGVAPAGEGALAGEGVPAARLRKAVSAVFQRMLSFASITSSRSSWSS
jgi:hypothetical protein